MKFMWPATSFSVMESENYTIGVRMALRRLILIHLQTKSFRAATKRVTLGIPGSVKYLRVMKNAEQTPVAITSVPFQKFTKFSDLRKMKSTGYSGST